MPFQPRVSAKQAAVINDRSRYVLVSGSRLSSKTWAVLHSIAWRMWAIPNYVGCIVAKTTSNASDSGIWSVLSEKVLPQWIAGDFGMEWVTPPRSTGITHKFFAECSNKAGGKSRIYLDSLDIENEVEDKYKSRLFNDVIISEASVFQNRATFDCLSDCLRMPDVPQEDHRMILDTNPATDGTSHWLWKLFYHFKGMDLENLDEDSKRELNLIDVDPAAYEGLLQSLRELQGNLSVHEFGVHHNDFISEEQKRAQFARYCSDSTRLKRYFYGLWVESAGDGVFDETFKEDIHLVGEGNSPENDDEMIPEEGCRLLCGGWDIGRKNTAAFIIEPIQIEVEELGRKIIKPAFKVLSEYVVLGKQQKLPEIAEAMMGDIEHWESFLPRTPEWQHWSDSSSFDLVSTQNERTEAQDLWYMTNGKIELKSIVSTRMNIKAHGGVERRVELLQRLFFENRIWINRRRCPELIKALNGLRRNAQSKIATNHWAKHACDGLTYVLAARLFMEMQRNTPRIRTESEAKILVTAL